MEAKSHRTFRQWTEEEFKAEILKFRGKYVDRMLVDFFNHWSEIASKNRMLFQVGKSWDTGKRLSKWRSNNYSRYDIDEQQIIQKSFGNTGSVAANPKQSNADKRNAANGASRTILGV